MTQNISPKIIFISELSKPFPLEGGRNNYEIFETVEDRYGVYIFLDKSNDVLYVGEAHKQCLKKRIQQYYTKENSGGTFRKNWQKEEEGRSFEDFKRALGDWKIVTISTSTGDKAWNRMFEGVLIYVLKPRYNR